MNEESLAKLLGVSIESIRKCFSQVASRTNISEKELLKILTEKETDLEKQQFLLRAKISLFAFFTKTSETKARSYIRTHSKKENKTVSEFLDDELFMLDPVFPLEIIQIILLYVDDPQTISNLCQTSKTMFKFCEEYIWKLKVAEKIGKDIKAPKGVSGMKFYFWFVRPKTKLAIMKNKILFLSPKNELWSGVYPTFKFKKENLGLKGISQISGIYKHYGILSQEGIKLHGSSEYNQVAPMDLKTKVIWISCGDKNTGAVTEEGEIYMIGSNGSGEIGPGYNRKLASTPQKLKTKIRFGMISCGNDDIAAVSLKGKVYVWGSGEDCHLGKKYLKKRTRSLINIKIPGYVTQVSCGLYHIGAVTWDGKLFTWGKNDRGQLGNGTYIDSCVPVEVLIPGHVIQVSCGSEYTGAVTREGKVYLWGENYGRQTGHPTEGAIIKPYELPFDKHVVEICCSTVLMRITVILTKQGKLYGLGAGVTTPYLLV